MARPKKNVKYEIVHTPSEPLIDATPNMHYILPLVKLTETMENKNQIFSFFTIRTIPLYTRIVISKGLVFKGPYSKGPVTKGFQYSF